MWGLCPLSLTWAVSGCYDGCSIKEVTLCVQGRPGEAITGGLELPPYTPCGSPAVSLWEARATWRGHRRHSGYPARPSSAARLASEKSSRWAQSPAVCTTSSCPSLPTRGHRSRSWGQRALRGRVLTHTIRDLLCRSVMVCYAAVDRRANDHCSYHSRVPSTSPAWYYALTLDSASSHLLCKIC